MGWKAGSIFGTLVVGSLEVRGAEIARAEGAVSVDADAGVWIIRD